MRHAGLFFIAVMVAYCVEEPIAASQSQRARSESSCDGLMRARENCANPASCAAIDTRLDAHGCAGPVPVCPCTNLVSPTGQVFCNSDAGIGVYFCKSTFPPDPVICQVFGGTFTAEEQQAICEACRIEYSDAYAVCAG